MIEHCQTYIVFFADTEDKVMKMRDDFETVEALATKRKEPNGDTLAKTYFPKDFEKLLKAEYRFDVDDRISEDDGKFHFAVCSDDLVKDADDTSVDLFAAVAKMYYPDVDMRYDCCEEGNGIYRKWDPERNLRDGEIHLFLCDDSLPAWDRAESSAVECGDLDDLKKALGDKFPEGAISSHEAIKKINASGEAFAAYWENVESFAHMEKTCDIRRLETVDISKTLRDAVKDMDRGKTK